MYPRAPLAISIVALIVAVLGTTPLGNAAGERLAATVPPFAKTAGFAKFAGNATKLNGRKSTYAGAPGTIPVVSKGGKLPASIGAIGPQGPKGEKGTDAATKIVIVRVFGNSAAPGQVSQATATCASGQRLIGGGAENISVSAIKKPLLSSYPTGQAGQAPTGWFVQALNDDTTGSVAAVARALCASP